MFDHFEYAPEYSDKFVCPKCRKPARDLQTKSFDNNLEVIKLKSDGSLESGCESEGEIDENLPYRWRIIKDTLYARVYTGCDCGRRWNEWRLHVRNGRVEEIVLVPDEE